MKTLRPCLVVFSIGLLLPSVPGASAPEAATASAAAPTKAPAPELAKAPTPELAKAPVAKDPVTEPAGEPVASTDPSGGPAKTPTSGAKASAAATLSPRFKQVRERVDALFQHRNEPPSPPDPRMNPFRPAGAAPVAATPAPGAPKPAAGAAIPAPLSSDLALLQQAVATLKVGGVIETAGRAHLVINAKPYKIGEVIQTKVQGESVFLRVRNITRNSVTLGLNVAEVTLKF